MNGIVFENFTKKYRERQHMGVNGGEAQEWTKS